MKLSGTYKFEAPQQRVWEFLIDPQRLQKCIPGAKELQTVGPNEYTGEIDVGIAAVKGQYKGRVKLEDLVPPESYKIVGEGEGGVAGFAKGGADVRLSDKDGGTLLTYNVEAQIGGKLAQLGGRLINGVAKNYADAFFANFAKAVSS